MPQIIATGGDGFSNEKASSAFDRYVITQTGKPQPSVCFLAQASGEAQDYIVRFYAAFARLGCHTTHLSLFKPHSSDLESFLLSQDVIYVGGGNTRSMLALWREWGLDSILRKAYDSGTVLAGVSAGAICWFEQATTDSIPGRLTRINGLGFLPGSCSPHYDSEEGRRPTFQRLIADGELAPGYAFDDRAAGHFVDGVLKQAVATHPGASAYRVEKTGDTVREIPLAMHYIND